MRRRLLPVAVGGIVAVVVSFLAWYSLARSEDPGRAGSGAPTAGAPADPAVDALTRRVLGELEAFTVWLDGQQGFIGEVGWPGREDERWNELADAWYEAADRSDLWVAAWAAGEWWDAEERLLIYGPARSAEMVPLPPARVVEAYPARPGVERGVNVNGGEFGIGANLGTGSGDTFSNVAPGRYGRTHRFDGPTTYEFLARRGVSMVRLPFRWERVQPVPGGPLDAAEVGHLRSAIDAARAEGLTVIPTVMNYGAYWLHDATARQGNRTPIGTPEVTEEHFIDLWRRLVGAIGNHPGVRAWGLMNEPVDLPGAAPAWERVSADVVAAIRAAGNRLTVVVPGYQWSTVGSFLEVHPGGPWIDDVADAVVYEGHHYFDGDRSGEYRLGYDDELRAVREQGR
jgi:hypothetical protein